MGQLIDLYRELWQLCKLRYYEAALAHLTRVDPCHPDIPGIVLKINELEK